MSLKLVDMLESPKEQKSMGYGAPLGVDTKPCYPYGLSLSLYEASLAKLGISKLPEPGEMIHLIAMAKVTGVSQNATDDKTSQRVELQITHLGLEDENEESVSSKLYDHKEEDGEE